jgi:ubiquinone/menaquinone biosynthesis C-methylase UbiE
MQDDQSKEHWEKIYSSKQANELSWTQENPRISLEFIHSFNLPRNASIIDVGGGDSKLVDKLIEEGFEDITVLDISKLALKRTKERLGNEGVKVHWVEADITKFTTEKTFDLWHDRATFHFLTNIDHINKYLERTRKYIKNMGFLTIGTFSDNGPRKCSGLDVKQYSEETLQAQLKNGFEKIKCLSEDHKTPFDTIQNFLFCSFRRQLK